MCTSMLAVWVQDEEGNPIAGPEFSAELAAELDQYGAAVGAPGQWASCVRLVDPAGVTHNQHTCTRACRPLSLKCIHFQGCVRL